MATLRCAGREIYYESHGEGPRVIVLLNGIMMSTDSWAAYVENLYTDHRVICFDFSGQGRSIATALTEEPKEDKIENQKYEFSQHIAELKDLLDQLEIGTASFLGTSYGGEVGLYFALQYPERVDFLGVVASVSEIDQELHDKVKYWQTESMKVAEGGSKREFFQMTLEYNFSEKYREAHKELLAERTELFEDVPLPWFIAFAGLCEGFQSLNLTGKLREIEVPVYFWGALNDQVKPPHLSEIIPRNLGNLVGQSWADSGHAMVIEKFDQVVREFRAHLPD